MADTIRTSLILLAVIAVSFLIGHCCGVESHTISESERVDTLLIRDTITQYEPIVEERVVLQKVQVPVVDTLWMHDTLWVYLEREQVIWEDSLSCVYASGILPQVDSVRHYRSERVVVKELTQVVKKPCRWGIGIQAGYGLGYNGKVVASPYVGIGISYNLISW